MKVSTKDRERFNDISWLMPSVDVDAVLDKLGIVVAGRRGDEIRALCPDHKLFVGRESSDPNWFLNVSSGKTNCYTEHRGSNLVWTVARLMGCHPRETLKLLLGADGVSLMSLDISRRRKERGRICPSIFAEYGADSVEEKPAVKGLAAIKRDMESRHMSEDAYEFFMNPPGKPPTNIRRETVDRFKVFERTWGTYANRVIIPFTQGGDVVGFCAVDILGKKKWLEEHPLKEKSDYRKTLYPADFSAGECLFGVDDFGVGDDVILVEDARSKMKLWQEGFPACVAILGSSFGVGQLKLLSEKRPRRVFLMFDGDDAGRSATESAAKRLGRNFKVFKCFTPSGTDPKNLDSEQIRTLMEKGGVK